MNSELITKEERLVAFQALFEMSQLQLGNDEFLLKVMKNALSTIVDMKNRNILRVADKMFINTFALASVIF